MGTPTFDMAAVGEINADLILSGDVTPAFCQVEDATAQQGASPAIILPASPVNVVDTVGAGDCFDAGFLFGFLNGWDTRRALELAIACGSLSGRKAGGTDGQPGLDEAMRFVEARMR
jgi:sugar/nucleoside kinase (ribokinase family)